MHKFIIVPLTILPIATIFNDSNSLPKFLGLLTGTLILMASKWKEFQIKHSLHWILLALAGLYFMGQIYKPISLESFLLGSWGRNGGFIALCCFVIIFVISSSTNSNEIYQFHKIFYLTSCAVYIYGLVQITKIVSLPVNSIYKNELIATFGNPNFTSAFIGMALSVQIYIGISNFRFKKFTLINTIVVGIGFYELFLTKSIQGYLVIIVNVSIFSVLFFYTNFKAVSVRFKQMISVAALLGATIFTINLQNLINWLVINGSIKQRIGYWKLALDIFQDNLLFGVGIDNMRDPATRYRSLELVKQEGIFTAPDRAHNVILDHFVNGGIFTGVAWVIVIVWISYVALKNIVDAKFKSESNLGIYANIIWFSYLTQSLISVDHIALTTLGIMSGGIILSRNKELKKVDVKSVIPSTILSRLSLILLFPILIFCFYFMTTIVKSEISANNFLNLNQPEYIEPIFNSKYVAPQTLEQVMVKLSKEKNFRESYKFANKLLIYRPNSHQAYYMRSVYFESLNEIETAKIEMLKAQKLDQYNSVYLLALAIYEYNLDNLSSAKVYLERAKNITPTQKGLQEVEAALILKQKLNIK